MKFKRLKAHLSLSTWLFSTGRGQRAEGNGRDTDTCGLNVLASGLSQHARGEPLTAYNNNSNDNENDNDNDAEAGAGADDFGPLHVWRNDLVYFLVYLCILLVFR